jgi:hypothetical protein
LLQVSKGECNGQIKRELNLALNTVKCWRKRGSNTYAALLAFEQEPQGEWLSVRDFGKQLLSTYKDAPRSGAPESISLAQK